MGTGSPHRESLPPVSDESVRHPGCQLIGNHEFRIEFLCQFLQPACGIERVPTAVRFVALPWPISPMMVAPARRLMTIRRG
jgi:hypothetical protein